MKEVRAYLGMKEIQNLTKQGEKPEFTGWKENNGIEILYEVRYTPAPVEPKGLQNCRIFDLVKIDKGQYQCKVCSTIHNPQGFKSIKSAAPVRFCHCGVISKQLQIHIPEPISGWETKPVFYTCYACGHKYMYHRFTCDSEACNNYCDITEVYCRDCQDQK